jgi:aryl-alcohol dehydrogenase-like predicted oxidoreductase
VAQVTEIADEIGCTPGQLALAWVLAQGEDIVPIPGTRRRVNLEQNVEAASIVLSAEQLNRLHEIAPQGAAGDRYADMSEVNI